ncbi:SMP-30/gluconolactonase/LRE family protein [Sphingomonas echinoides]|uniref:SMP-30/gluconolactonase/LRE family protein n=1 Tax=Sphingomonas echinoides TaxID=59803 RepID=A0ABU4PP49_9SPHN|nr:SMP-30/gluconolactonase/LRE family protein [Sphingomonas echinoides]MDX5984897.1 SMP-30/gluconolactonase/LRE family protein [Sphingomonas echinoides]
MPAREPMPQWNRRSVIGAGLGLLAAPVIGAGVASAAEATVTPQIVRLAPGLDRYLSVDTPIETIATGIRWAEGPVWVPHGDYLLFSDPPANVIRRWSRAKGTELFLSPSDAVAPDPATVREGGSNGLTLDHSGNLLIAGSGSRAVVRLDLKTKRRTVLVDRYQGKRFNSVNDLCVAADGAIYFTDPPYGLVGGDQSALKEQPHNGVYRWTPGGAVELVDGTLSRPNGIALSGDGKTLFVSVSDEQEPRIMAYALDAHGLPTARTLWLDAKPMLAKAAPGLPDGMKIARDGTHFNSVPGGMMLLTPEAEPLGLIATGAPIPNCAFGEDGRTLFLTANDRVLRLRLKVSAL